MDDKAIKATKKKRKLKADKSFENVQHIVTIQIYYGEKAISSLTLTLEPADFQNDNSTIDSFQNYLLEAIKIRLNEIKELQERGDDKKPEKKQCTKDIRKFDQ